MYKLSWDNATSPERVELVFENRNKSYGAFQIRRSYEKTVLTAFLISVAAIVFAFYLPTIIRAISGAAERITTKPKVTVTELAPPPPMDETKPPPPPPDIKLPDLKQVNFTPPVIKPDEEVVEEVVTLKEMENAIIGTENNLEGDTVTYDLPQTNTVIETNDEPVIFADEMPEFPGGEEAMYAFLHKTIQYPPLAKEANVQGKVIVQFVVEKDGSITDVKVLRGPEYGLREEAERAVKKLPKFKPGIQNGKPVRVFYQLPIIFNLE
jgi:periplasmic protein TonB